MAEDVQGQAAEASESSESSEAQIAVHWREEGYYPPPPKFIGQANASDPAILDRFAEENFPECFREYADLLHWDEYWHTTLDTSNRAVLEVVRRRQAERLLQLRGPAPGQGPEQGRADLGARARGRRRRVRITYQELYRRVNEFAAVLRTSASRPATGSPCTCRWCPSCR